MASATAVSTLAPMRRRTFRAMWIAQFVSNTGTWTQTVGAQWLMGDLGGGPLEIALVQTAATLPIFLFVIPAGALGDIVDRRRLLLGSEGVILMAAAGLALFTWGGAINQALLLGLTALMGIGQAVSNPSFQSIQPDLVSREEIAQAALLNGANVNIARALGPALGGVLIAAVGPGATFALNAVSYVGVLAVLYAWRRPIPERPLGAEQVHSAIRAGWRYVRAAPAFGAVLARMLLFMLFASGLWALLPAAARGPLGLGPSGYGVLLACLGIGAVSGAFLVPMARRRVGAEGVVVGATLAYAGAMLVIGLVDSARVVAAVLVVAGLAWIAVQSTLSAAAQTLLPRWTRARALAYSQLVFMGGQAIGAVLWGVVAEAADIQTAFVIPAAALVLGGAVGLRMLPLRMVEADVTPTRHWPEPGVILDPARDAGPVLVTVEWDVDPEDADAFVEAMRPVGASRRRTGATLWGLFQDTEQPTLFLETFTVGTWHEHLRQHIERGTALDEGLEARARGLARNGEAPRVRHFIWAYGPRLTEVSDEAAQAP